MSGNPEQLPNCLKREETSVILIIVDGVLCDVHSVTVTGGCQSSYFYLNNMWEEQNY